MGDFFAILFLGIVIIYCGAFVGAFLSAEIGGGLGFCFIVGCVIVFIVLKKIYGGK